MTELLQAWGAGEQEALDQLIPLVRGELHRLAQWHMRKERAGHTLQPTALVNEAYLRLVDLHPERRGKCGGAEGLAGNRAARLEDGEGLAASRADEGRADA